MTKKHKPEPNSVQVLKPKATVIKRAADKAKAEAETAAILKNSVSKKASAKSAPVVKKAV